MAEDPSNDHINTGHSGNDFTIGERVLVWWANFWWYATIEYIRKTDGRVSVRWDWNPGVVTKKYL
jgi:hypothetical protein